MVSSSIQMTISLLLIMAKYHSAEVNLPPLFCGCHTNISDPSGASYPCFTANCSRGDNLNCTTDPSPTFYPKLRSFEYLFVDGEAAALFGCSCPGFNYNHGHGGDNGANLEFFVTGPAYQTYKYNNCNDFGDGSSEAVACCYYCCGPDPSPSLSSDNSHSKRTDRLEENIFETIKLINNRP